MPIKLGASQGASGLLVTYAAAKMRIKTKVAHFTEISAISDCCSSYAQWAFSSQSVDAAVVCVDAARSLVEKDKRYSIIGPCLANSDLVVVRNPANAQNIGIAQNHQYQKEIVRRIFGGQCRVKPMLSTALAYAYAKASVDGIVVDVEEALHLSGTKISVARRPDDLITYVLVASKAFQKQTAFNHMITAFREAAVDLNSPDKLRLAIINHSRYPADERGAAQWIQMGIRFMVPR